MRAPRPQANAGFTLIELVVASTLMVLVLSGVYLTFTTAVRSWRGAEANYATFEDARRALGLLDRELHGIPLAANHLTRGTADSIEFVTLAQPLDVETASSERLLLVRYRFVEERGGGQLLREEAPVLSALPLPPSDDGEDLPAPLHLGRTQRFVVANGVASFALNYSWAGPQISPTPQAPPRPAVMYSENFTNLALPELIDATLELEDPGNAAEGLARFHSRITFRRPASPMPKSMQEKAGLL